jgi:hypothetical protein
MIPGKRNPGILDSTICQLSRLPLESVDTMKDAEAAAVIVCTPSVKSYESGVMVASVRFGARGTASVKVPDTKSLVVYEGNA